LTEADVTKRFFFDTETTDLVSNTLLPINQQPRIIEFYGCLLDDEYNMIEEIESFVDPGIEISPEITRITGITPSHIVGAPKFQVIAETIKSLIGRSDEVIAHNLSYDLFVLETEMKRINRTVIWPKLKTCTVESTEWIKGYRLSLSAMHEEFFKEPFSGAHRARVDVEAMIRCFKHARRECLI
jgi:DNA polymerase-3 subunit epsilon